MHDEVQGAKRALPLLTEDVPPRISKWLVFPNALRSLFSRTAPAREKCRYWFREYFAIDLRVLACLRMVLAALVLLKLLTLWPDLEAFYSDNGVMPRTQRIEGTNYLLFSFFLANGTLFWSQLLFVVHGACASLLLIGYRTRLASFLTWLFFVSLCGGNWVIMNSGDFLLSIMLLWGCLVPWGGRHSIDAAVSPIRPKVTDGKVVGIGTVALLSQMPFVYFFGAFMKHKEAAWTGGREAIAYVLFGEYSTGIGVWLRETISFETTQILTTGTLRLELLAPLLFFFPLCPVVQRWLAFNLLAWTRAVAVMAFILLHLSLMLLLDLVQFQLVAMASLIPFLPRSFGGWFFLGRFKAKAGRWKRPAILQVVLNRWIPSRQYALKTPLILTLIGSCLFSYSIATNLKSLDAIGIPDNIDNFGRSIRLRQHWGMFRDPAQQAGYYVIAGLLRDGTVIDLFGEQGPVSGHGAKELTYEPPPSLSSRTYINNRWRFFLRKNHHEKYRYYGRYITRQWNSQNEGDRELLCFYVYYISRKIEPHEMDYMNEEPNVNFLWRHFAFSQDDFARFPPIEKLPRESTGGYE